MCILANNCAKGYLKTKFTCYFAWYSCVDVSGTTEHIVWICIRPCKVFKGNRCDCIAAWSWLASCECQCIFVLLIEKSVIWDSNCLTFTWFYRGVILLRLAKEGLILVVGKSNEYPWLGLYTPIQMFLYLMTL